MHVLRPFLSALCLALLLFAATGATRAFAAASPLEMRTEDERLVRWDLTADSLITHNDTEVLEAKGNVVLRRGNDVLKADFARYYMSTKWVFLQGNVVVRMGKDDMRAEQAEFDLRSRVGWLKNGEIFMEGPHAYLSGTRINKYWGDVYTFQNAKVTTCDTEDGQAPAWSLTADEAIVEMDGYARLVRSSFQVKGTPVAYTPYFLFPTKTDRQTGFLVPEFGNSSKKGFFYNQPFFWAINQQSDLMVNGEMMTKRGFMHGVEYRTQPSNTTKGWIRYDWLYDQERDTSGRDATLFSGETERTNRNRYWVRGMLDTRFDDPRWRLKADLDYVSDQDYLTDFKSGMGGFNRSRDEMFSWFSRDLQEKNKKRESGVLLSRDWERVTVSLYGAYTQNPTLGHGNYSRSSDTTVQRLPQLDAFLHKGRIFSSLPLEANVSAQAGYYYRRTGTRGARYEVVPTLTVPITGRLGSLITSAGVRQTIYNTESASQSRWEGELASWEAERGGRETDVTRTLPEFSSAASTELARVYDFKPTPLPLTNSTVGESRWQGLRHAVQPRVEFAYRRNENQEDNPYYDEMDRLMPHTEVAYSLTNVITRKRHTVVMEKNDKGEMVPKIKEDFIDLLRLRLEQAYDQREATRTDMRDRYERRPFGDVLGEATFGLTSVVSLYTRNYYSPYENKLTRHESGMGFVWPEYGHFSFGYDQRMKIDEYKRRRDSNIQYISTRAGFTLFGGSIGLDTGFNQDFKDTSNREVLFDLTYNHQCFSIIGRTVLEPDDKSYSLMVKLTGLGD